MNDITHLTNLYRESARHLWNVSFMPLLKSVPNDWLLQERFEDVAAVLFSALVLHPIGKDTWNAARGDDGHARVSPFLRVVPTSATGVPVSINRDRTAGGYWDYPLQQLRPEEADVRFISFFDFDVLASRDFTYCRVRIVASEKHPELVGRDALIEATYVKIVAGDEG